MGHFNNFKMQTYFKNSLQNGHHRVGYIGNLHMMAYQGKENLVGQAMTEVQVEFSRFRARSLRPDEKTSFAVISGDFNIDNISPGEGFIFVTIRCTVQ